MHFEDLPTTPTSEELVDKAFSRAARAGRAKSGKESHESMIQTAANIISDNLENIVTTWPDFQSMDQFYVEIADATLAETSVTGVDSLRKHLSAIMWASRQITSLRDEYFDRIRSADTETAQKLRKQAFARMADISRQVSDDLNQIQVAREALKVLPDIRPETPTIVIAGYPNVGKSSFVNSVTNARNEIAEYPYTTTQIYVGHIDHDHIRYQLIDTPGLLDRPAEDRNAIESQTVSALTHIADLVIVVLDASETCGYPVDSQIALLDEIKSTFEASVMPVINKSDLATMDEIEHTMSVKTDDGVEAVINQAIDTLNFEPKLPFEEAH